MVDGQLRGEAAELHRKDGKLISSWKYTAELDDSSVSCVVEGEEERSTAIELNIKEENQETVTLRDMDEEEEYGSEEYEDEDDEEGKGEEDAATDRSEADAIENLSASAS